MLVRLQNKTVSVEVIPRQETKGFSQSLENAGYEPMVLTHVCKTTWAELRKNYLIFKTIAQWKDICKEYKYCKMRYGVIILFNLSLVNNNSVYLQSLHRS